MRINFDFADLEAFLAVKKCGSFLLAADRLNLSQSAVTRRIQKLEEVLGAVLFDRSTRSVHPTLAAKRLQVRAEAILAEAEETLLTMRDETVAYVHQRAAVVTVAVLPTVVAGLLVPSLKVWRSAGNNARLRLLDVAANELAEAVAAGEADFGLGAIPSLEPGTEFETLYDDRIMVVLPKTHGLAKLDALSWGDLAGQALILPARGTGNRLLIDEAAARARRPLTWTVEVARSATALDLVAEDTGVALLPASATERLSGMVARPLIGPEILRPVGLLTRPGQRETAAVVALKEALREISRSRPRD